MKRMITMCFMRARARICSGQVFLKGDRVMHPWLVMLFNRNSKLSYRTAHYFHIAHHVRQNFICSGIHRNDMFAFGILSRKGVRVSGATWNRVGKWRDIIQMHQHLLQSCTDIPYVTKRGVGLGAEPNRIHT